MFSVLYWLSVIFLCLSYRYRRKLATLSYILVAAVGSYDKLACWWCLDLFYTVRGTPTFLVAGWDLELACWQWMFLHSRGAVSGNTDVIWSLLVGDVVWICFTEWRGSPFIPGGRDGIWHLLAGQFLDLFYGTSRSSYITGGSSGIVQEACSLVMFGFV